MLFRSATWKFIEENLSASRPVVLMCVTQSSGSSPGRAGFKMAVSGVDMSGSIGGGIMEHKFVELAREKLKDDKCYPFLKKQYHQKSAARDQSGMICSGEQTVLLFPLGIKNLPVVRQLIGALEKHRSGTLKIKSNQLNFITDIPEHEFAFEMIAEMKYTNLFIN